MNAVRRSLLNTKCYAENFAEQESTFFIVFQFGKMPNVLT